MAFNSHYVCCGRSRVNKEDKIRQSVSSAFLSSIHSITISKSPVSNESWKWNNSASALSLVLCTNSPRVQHLAPSNTERQSTISKGNSVWSIFNSRSFPKCLAASEKFWRSVRRSLHTLTSLRSKTLNSSDWKENILTNLTCMKKCTKELTDLPKILFPQDFRQC